MTTKTSDKDRKDAKHKAAMKKQKASVDASISAADTERGGGGAWRCARRPTHGLQRDRCHHPLPPPCPPCAWG